MPLARGQSGPRGPPGRHVQALGAVVRRLLGTLMVERHPALGKTRVSPELSQRSVGGGVTVFAELTKKLVLVSLMSESGPG